MTKETGWVVALMLLCSAPAFAQGMELKDTASGKCWSVANLGEAGDGLTLATCNGSANQQLTLDAPSGEIYESGVAWGWCLREDTVAIDVCWDGYPEKWAIVNGYIQSQDNAGKALLPGANGIAILAVPPQTIVTPPGTWVNDQQAASSPPPPPSGLQAIPVAMFSPENPNATDPDKATGSWEYWGTTLQKTGPVITMPLAVGVNPSYGGDAFGWADPSSIMVQDTNPAWMLSVGLNMPSGPTLTAAGTGSMDQDWGNAAGSARFGANYAHSTGANLWDPSGMAQARSVLYIRPGWEMTGSWYTWGSGSPGQVSTWNADFKAAYRRVVGIFRAACAVPDKNGHTCTVVSIFNPNGDYNTPAAINLDAFYPGDDVVDVMAIDIYDMPQWNGGYQADGVTPTLSAAQRFAQFQMPNLQAIDAYARAHGKKVGICEWAAGDGGGDNPTFVNQVAAWAAAASSPVAALGYWSGGSGSGYNGDITIYPQQKAAFIANFGG